MAVNNGGTHPPGIVHSAVVKVNRPEGLRGTTRITTATIGSHSPLAADKVGKSALTIQLVQNHFIEDYDYDGTDSYRKRFRTENTNYVFELYDFYCENVQEEAYFFKTKCEICFVVFSVVDQKSYEHAIEQLHALRRLERQDNLPLIYLVGNKIDLVKDDTQSMVVVTTEMAQSQAQQLNVGLLFTSAKTRLGVDDLLVGATKDFEAAVRGAAEATKKNGKQVGRCSTM